MSSSEAMMSTYFDKLNGPRVTAVLNVLGEAPFFYRADDPDLFQFLRRNRAEFTRFYDELYGWELIVDGRTARVYKERWHNRALRPSQHDVFDLTRRSDCLGFLLLLEFYGRLLETHNLAGDDAESPRFEFGELFEFARTRLAEELGLEAPADDEVRRTLRGLWPTLERYRFVRAVPRELDVGDGGGAESVVPGAARASANANAESKDEDRVLYEALPGLHHYDLRRLGPAALTRALGGDPQVSEPAGAEVAP